MLFSRLFSSFSVSKSYNHPEREGGRERERGREGGRDRGRERGRERGERRRGVKYYTCMSLQYTSDTNVMITGRNLSSITKQVKLEIQCFPDDVNTHWLVISKLHQHEDISPWQHAPPTTRSHLDWLPPLPSRKLFRLNTPIINTHKGRERPLSTHCS